MDLCPACARRDQEPDGDGFCSPCSRERIIENYGEQDAKRAHMKGTAWRTRTDEAREFDKLRQQRRRLLVQIRPREAPPFETDPWIIAAEGLNAATQLRACARTTQARARLERVEECIRRLAFGPEEVTVSPTGVPPPPTCAGCRVEFEPRRPDQRYCSQRCRRCSATRRYRARQAAGE